MNWIGMGGFAFIHYLWCGGFKKTKKSPNIPRLKLNRFFKGAVWSFVLNTVLR